MEIIYKFERKEIRIDIHIKLKYIQSIAYNGFTVIHDMSHIHRDKCVLIPANSGRIHITGDKAC